MGWTHAQAAGKTLERIEAAARKSREGVPDSPQNVFYVDLTRYFYQITVQDQEGGGIAGQIYVYKGDTDMCLQDGDFFITGEGKLIYGWHFWTLIQQNQ